MRNLAFILGIARSGSTFLRLRLGYEPSAPARKLPFYVNLGAPALGHLGMRLARRALTRHVPSWARRASSIRA